jgi:hypothetical protein
MTGMTSRAPRIVTRGGSIDSFRRILNGGAVLSCMAALHAAESRASAALRFGMPRFPCPCRPPCPGRQGYRIQNVNDLRKMADRAKLDGRIPRDFRVSSKCKFRKQPKIVGEFRWDLPAQEGPTTCRLRTRRAGHPRRRQALSPVACSRGKCSARRCATS